MMPGKHLSPSDQQSDVRLQLQTELLSAVKNCQSRFGGRKELATELDEHVQVLCTCLEYVLGHGLRAKPVVKKNSTFKQVTDKVLGVNGLDHMVFWHFVREHLTKHEKERYDHLRHVWTDVGRGRAWLRSALNERSLERYMLCLLDSSSDLIIEFYEDWAFLRDQERNSILPTMAAGLGSILFAISIDKPELNHSSAANLGGSSPPNFTSQGEPVIPPPVNVPGTRRSEGRRRKRNPPNIISFDDDSDTAHSYHDDINTPPSPNPIVIPDITTQPQPAANIDGASIAITVGVDCLEPESNNADLDSAFNYSEHDLPTSVGLRPVSNTSVGELIPVPLTEETHSSEDSLSVPSFSEEVECSGVVEVGAVVVVSGVEEQSGQVENGVESKGTLGAEDEIAKLRRLLTIERESSDSLRAQMVQSHKQHQDKTQNTETRIQTLNRENEVLKHQLRKYVMAVQTLQQDNSADHEARLYEQKLVQVAEMHGELMEMNDRLQRILMNKEGLIQRLREELEALRGPLPLDSESDDLGPTLISLWIPSVFLSGQSPDTHHVYQVHVRICDEEWNVYRRYAQFYSLHKQLKKQHAVISTFQFPPKKTIGNKDARFVEERRHRLQQYLRRVMNHLVLSNPGLSVAPSKPLLISLLPFFGEITVPDDRQRSNSRNPFSRRSLPESPQYTGL